MKELFYIKVESCFFFSKNKNTCLIFNASIKNCFFENKKQIAKACSWVFVFVKLERKRKERKAFNLQVHS